MMFKYRELANAFQCTRGFSIHSDMRSIGTSFRVFHGNQIELQQKLQKHSNPAIALKQFHGMHQRGKLQREFEEIIRLLQNYVASVNSLVDHTRRIAKRILIGEYLEAYEARKSETFVNDGLSRFLHKLRNYLLHYSQPPVSSTIRFEENRFASIRIELPASQLLKWDDWCKQSRTFIEEHEDAICLESAVHEYAEKVRDFYRWLESHVNIACKPELDEFWQKHDAWVAYSRENGLPVTDEDFAKRQRTPKG